MEHLGDDPLSNALALAGSLEGYDHPLVVDGSQVLAGSGETSGTRG
jgi:hypothetical protein